MEQFVFENLWIIAIYYFIWELPWKGMAMWKAAQRGHKGWFVAILLLNTVGILPIGYLLFFKQHEQVQQ